jgi:hypothetical protein
MIAAHPSRARAPEGEVKSFLGTLAQYVKNFDTSASRAGPNIEYIKTHFGYPTEDIQVTLTTSALLNY